MTLQTATPDATSETPLADKVRFLASADAWPAGTKDVEARETHMSWVFLAGPTVLKLKKPVRNTFLDFSTLAAREANCREEVRLNRRLAGDVYRGVLPLTRSPDGGLQVGGDGHVVEWLVHMRRLPAEAMLDAVLRSGRLTRAQVEAVGERLAAFYRAAERPDIDADLPWQIMKVEQAENRDVLGRVPGAGDQARRIAIVDRLEALLDSDREVLARRVVEGHVVDGHGDLRPEHVCLVEPPLIIDCLEFNRGLRLVDPFDETAFLGLECERLGAPWVDSVLRAQIAAGLGREPSPRLLALYRAFRSVLRARLALAHLLDPKPRTPEKWEPMAEAYLRIAEDALNAAGRREAR
ncbi:hypothetical protein ACUN0C_13980 [Faunimonas sp. B44]|uniref:hypothetical protein n=1 Tax=Faunimonas sp. B44 TaxID=3461493 RepID=UPI00404505CE